MKKREMQKFKKLLLAEGEHLTKGIRTIGEDTLQAAGQEAGTDMSSFAEAGTDNNDRETALRLAGGESQMLREVSEALLRIEEGTYGKCVDCDEEIPVKRLEVFPAAKRCVECKSRFEKEGGL
ncbi:MAG: TraR/DksA family transcriptional regulator [Candidatus Hydrogenedentes bacterium]|nr:TraR/DksA family transcriptional regulator [Candidatus Hydrogenedentota bacterium]